jgi:2-dehydro-3-deoxyglucarate aldolase/4-hydroxy-2-oxoheptanedioate aldolase
MIERNGDLRERIARQEPVALGWCASGQPVAAEIAAAAGLPAVVLDAQHGLWTRAGIEAAVGTLQDRPVLVRVAENGAAAIGEALDAGAEGVIVPMVESAEEAAGAVAHARYPPEGRRSVGGPRPLMRDFGAWVQDSLRRTVVGVMIETEAGLAAAREIAGVPGVDFVFVGTGDLSVALGPRARAAMEPALAAVRVTCTMAGRPCGLYTPDAAAARARFAEGFTLAVAAADLDLLGRGFRAAAAALDTD